MSIKTENYDDLWPLFLFSTPQTQPPGPAAPPCTARPALRPKIAPHAARHMRNGSARRSGRSALRTARRRLFAGSRESGPGRSHASAAKNAKFYYSFRGIFLENLFDPQNSIEARLIARKKLEEGRKSRGRWSKGISGALEKIWGIFTVLKEICHFFKKISTGREGPLPGRSIITVAFGIHQLQFWLEIGLFQFVSTTWYKTLKLDKFKKISGLLAFFYTVKISSSPLIVLPFFKIE